MTWIRRSRFIAAWMSILPSWPPPRIPSVVRWGIVSFMCAWSGSGADVGFRFDLDEHLRADEARDLHHGGRGTHRAERFAVRLPDALPVSHARDVDPRPDDVGELRAGALERPLDVLERLDGLEVRVA